MDNFVYNSYIKSNFGSKNVKSIVLTLVGGEKINILSADSINFVNGVLILKYSNNISCIDFAQVIMVSVNK